MRVQKSTSNLTEPEKAQFESHLEKKLERIVDYIKSHYPDDDTAKLDVHMIKHDKHTAFEFEYVLHLPRTHKPLVSKVVKHSVTEPMDLATDKMEAQLRKHFKKLIRE